MLDGTLAARAPERPAAPVQCAASLRATAAIDHLAPLIRYGNDRLAAWLGAAVGAAATISPNPCGGHEGFFAGRAAA